MYQNQKANILVLSIVAVLVISLATPVAQADLDISGIYITSCKDHLDGEALSIPWVFEVWVDFVDRGSLHHIDVTDSASFTIDDDWYESSTDYSTLTALRGDYPTGNYKFEFEDSSNTVLRTVNFDYSGISEPLSAVDFTDPSENNQTDIPLDPTFTWTIDPGDGDALGMWLWDPVAMDDVYEDVPVLMTETSWTPGPLLPNHDYDLEVSVFGIKDGVIGTMTVGGDTFECYPLIEHMNEIDFTTVPVPGAVFLGAIGLGMTGWLCRHRAQ